VLAAQEPDGYLGAYRATDNRREDFNAFGVAWAVRALMAFHEATGDARVPEACRRALLWFVNHWGAHKTDYAGPMIIEAMVAVYLSTGDRRLLKWAEGYMRWLGRRSKWPNSVAALAAPRLDFNSAHVVAYGIWLSLPAILAAANGRRDYLEASERAARKIIRKCFQRTGAPSSNNEYLSPPGATCETEYCNFATFANAFAWLALISGKPAYGDLIEKIVFNGAQGAKKKDGKAIAYMSSPNQFFATAQSSVFSNRPDMEVYAPVYPVACCPTQAVRVLPEFVRGLCLTDARGGLYMTCYGPCRITAEPIADVRLSMDETTEYPFKETIAFHLKLNRPARFSLHFRIPAWCRTARLMVNGNAVPGVRKPNSYAVISRMWRSGDKISLVLPMEVKIIEVNDRAFSHKLPLAVERGPLLFCLPIKPVWKEIPGNPLTPLPKGWSWFEALPTKKTISGEYRFGEACTWNYALSRSVLERRNAMRVVVRKTGAALPWERSPVAIRVPARRYLSAFAPYTRSNVEIYASPDGLCQKDETVDLVPYGCTNLRVAYFPRY